MTGTIETIQLAAVLIVLSLTLAFLVIYGGLVFLATAKELLARWERFNPEA